MKKSLKWGLVGVVVVLVGAQFVRPDRTNPPVDASARIGARLAVPADVQHLLDQSCADCHTHATEWPWYTSVAPVSWIVAGHVAEGREYLNFDMWSQYSDDDAQKLLEDIAEEVLRQKMPLPQYLRLHAEAELLDRDRQRLAEWARAERGRILEQLGSGADANDEH